MARKGVEEGSRVGREETVGEGEWVGSGGDRGDHD